MCCNHAVWPIGPLRLCGVHRQSCTKAGPPRPALSHDLQPPAPTHRHTAYSTHMYVNVIITKALHCCPTDRQHAEESASRISMYALLETVPYISVTHRKSHCSPSPFAWEACGRLQTPCHAFVGWSLLCGRSAGGLAHVHPCASSAITPAYHCVPVCTSRNRTTFHARFSTQSITPPRRTVITSKEPPPSCLAHLFWQRTRQTRSLHVHCSFASQRRGPTDRDLYRCDFHLCSRSVQSRELHMYICKVSYVHASTSSRVASHRWDNYIKCRVCIDRPSPACKQTGTN